MVGRGRRGRTRRDEEESVPAPPSPPQQRGPGDSEGPDIESLDEITARKVLEMTLEVVRKTLPTLAGDKKEMQKFHKSVEKMFITLLRSQMIQTHQGEVMRKLEAKEKPDLKVYEAATDDEAMAVCEEFRKKYEKEIEKYQQTLTDDYIRKLKSFKPHAETLSSILDTQIDANRVEILAVERTD